MTRSEYRKARRLVRSNGLYALRWLTPDHAGAMFAISRPAGDYLALRADLARHETSAIALRLTTNVTRSDKNVSIHTKND